MDGRAVTQRGRYDDCPLAGEETERGSYAFQAGEGLKLIPVTQQLYVTILYGKKFNSRELKKKKERKETKEKGKEIPTLIVEKDTGAIQGIQDRKSSRTF